MAGRVTKGTVAVVGGMALAVAGAAIAIALWAKPRPITGTLDGYVTDEEGTPIIGAHVMAENTTTKSVTTLYPGYFEMPLPPGNYVVTVTAVARKTVILESVVIEGGMRTTINVFMEWEG